MSMRLLTQDGAIDGSVRDIINGNFAATQGIDVWVRPQAALSEQTGTYSQPFVSMAAATRLMTPGSVVGLQGVLRENFTAPYVNDITVVGIANTPRQATSGGAPNGGGATWLSPTTVTNTAPLVAVKLQGWRFQNLFFNNAATTAPCVSLDRDAAAQEADASHASFIGCKFTGTDDGIWNNGGASFVTITGCEFFNFAGTGDRAIKSNSTAIALPLQWQIVGNRFYNNDGHIVMPLSSGNVQGNVFGYIGSSITTAVQLQTGGGGINNTVWQNVFQMDEATGTATMFGGGTADSWAGNYFGDQLKYGIPV